MFSAYHCACNAEWKVRQELAKAYQLAALFQWTDLIYTHISARIPDEENTFLINPFGLHFHEVTPENLVKVSLEGEILSQTPYSINRAGSVIHTAIHTARPDIKSIVHLHTVNGMAISSLENGLLPISQHACHFYGKIAYHDYQGIAIHDDEKEELVKNLGHMNTMILRNHGFLTAGQSLEEAFTSMYTLEKAAEVQIAALSMGQKLIFPEHKVCQKVVMETGQHNIKNAKIEWDALKRLLPSQLSKHVCENYSIKHEPHNTYRDEQLFDLGYWRGNCQAKLVSGVSLNKII